MSMMTHVPLLSSQEISKSSKSLIMMESLHTSNLARDSKFGTHVLRHVITNYYVIVPKAQQSSPLQKLE